MWLKQNIHVYKSETRLAPMQVGHMWVSFYGTTKCPLWHWASCGISRSKKNAGCTCAAGYWACVWASGSLLEATPSKFKNQKWSLDALTTHVYFQRGGGLLRIPEHRWASISEGVGAKPLREGPINVKIIVIRGPDQPLRQRAKGSEKSLVWNVILRVAKRVMQLSLDVKKAL